MTLLMELQKYKTEGMQEGIEIGMKQGMEKGMNRKGLEIAKKMLAKGMDETTIMEMTGLSQEQIRSIM